MVDGMLFMGQAHQAQFMGCADGGPAERTHPVGSASMVTTTMNIGAMPYWVRGASLAQCVGAPTVHPLCVDATLGGGPWAINAA